MTIPDEVWYAEFVGAVERLPLFLKSEGQNMKIWVLAENTACDKTMESEHGLSLYIETGCHKILFDAGQTDLFARNAEKLGVDLGEVTMAVLSHGHYDHGGGMGCFLEKNRKAEIYVNPLAFEPHYHGMEKYIGLDSGLKDSNRLRMVTGETELAPGIRLSDCGSCKPLFPIDSCGLSVLRDGKPEPDTFDHEQYLLVEEEGKQILFSGCSHRGICNIAEWFRPDILIGGFHLKTFDPAGEGAEHLEQTAQRLLKYDTRYYTCHCTGAEQYRFMKNIMGPRLFYLGTGAVLTL